MCVAGCSIKNIFALPFPAIQSEIKKKFPWLCRPAQSSEEGEERDNKGS